MGDGDALRVARAFIHYYILTLSRSVQRRQAVQAISDYTAQMIKGRLIKKMVTRRWDHWCAYRLCDLTFLKPKHARSLS